MKSYKYSFSNGFEETLSNAYHQNYSTSATSFKLGTIVVSLMLLTPGYTNAEINSDDRNVLDYAKNTFVSQMVSKSIPGKESSIDNLKLFVPRSAAYSREFVNNSYFIDSFKKNCSKNGRIVLEPLFNMMAASLNTIKIEKSYIDVSEKRGLIEFNMNIGKGVVVTVLKDLSSIKDNMVDFTVSMDGELRVVDSMPISDLTEKLINLQREFPNA